MNRTSAIVGVVLVVTIWGLCAIGFQRASDRAALVQCENQLKMLGLGLQGYYDTNKHLPRALVSTPSEDRLPETIFSWQYAMSPWLVAHMDPNWKINRDVPF